MSDEQPYYFAFRVLRLRWHRLPPKLALTCTGVLLLLAGSIWGHHPWDFILGIAGALLSGPARFRGEVVLTRPRHDGL